ncbi:MULTISPECIES: histidinol-phosphate transaminase [Ramlibacter]|uniref:Histidinol-phosphate aminotransferase n=1 Tax=Ramlibacter pinisoli TaxID=2682844 RepID=A0A6N8IQX1_9BURK|nr:MULTISPECIES: histidinol-phosphate transaminase [Ramlibacter]MBA2964282.1 histidinol-phosphate transaminase [Ramlibacter sp. CGMCC 1.13660]MVQ29248.1 histidinol-phosphate transaminase [Ramlibacter pinisoli]
MLHLAANENPLGMPHGAQTAAQQALADAGRYPDGSGVQLKAALSARLGVAPEGIVLGSGSCEILTMAAQALVRPGEGIVSSQYGFLVYGQAARLAHAVHTVVPARDFGHDLAAMAQAIDAGTRLVFIANPNNPTGTFLAGDELQAFLRAVPAQVTVLLDEAYTEYLTPAQRYDAVGWVRQLPNLVVARTFSKAYGLAGLRVGYGIAQPALAARFEPVRPRFNLTGPALAAAAAALADDAFQARSHALNLAGREQLGQGLQALGLRCLPSAGNFVMVEAGDAAGLHRALLAQGIAVATLDAYGLPRWLRITVGLPEQNTRVLDAVRAFQSSAAAATT